ncbi:hypothetical protein BKA64DRAFT_34726 [Cadophora sp. MPI-SDFR-AT-0126]|nr:hypothetical protein BKA64DRAFT_34726 [Leotiomycetes sp. MPI-SDFR-AT-0126]
MLKLAVDVATTVQISGRLGSETNMLRLLDVLCLASTWEFEGVSRSEVPFWNSEQELDLDLFASFKVLDDLLPSLTRRPFKSMDYLTMCAFAITRLDPSGPGLAQHVLSFLCSDSASHEELHRWPTPNHLHVKIYLGTSTIGRQQSRRESGRCVFGDGQGRPTHATHATREYRSINAPTNICPGLGIQGTRGWLHRPLSLYGSNQHLLQAMAGCGHSVTSTLHG